MNRLPASTLADFQKGDAVMVVSTQGTDAGGVTAITMLGGVEAILAAAPAGNAAQAMTLSPWSLGGGAPAVTPRAEINKFIISSPIHSLSGDGMKARVFLFSSFIAVIIALVFFCSERHVCTDRGTSPRSPHAAAAQIGTGTIRGQVTDPSAAAVVGASIIATAPDGTSLAATTNRDGVFELKGVAPGKYTVEVIAKGFALYKNDAVQVAAGQIQQLNVSLTIEAEQQQVTVTDQSGAVDVSPTNNAGAIVINGAALDALPDDPDELQTDLTALAGPSAGPNGGQFYIDGFTAGQLPPKSAIREIRINQNPFSAQYDKVGYGRIEIFTKPGTDKWHGGFSVNGNDSAFNTRNPFFNSSEASGTPYPGYYSVQYSGNIGGPLSKKASFFFTEDIRDINDLGIVNAQVVNPTTFAVTPFSAAVPNPRTRYNIGPRLDYALTKNNTLTVRYQYYRNSENQRRRRRLCLAVAGLQYAEHRADAAGGRHADFRHESGERNALSIFARAKARRRRRASRRPSSFHWRSTEVGTAAG